MEGMTLRMYPDAAGRASYRLVRAGAAGISIVARVAGRRADVTARPAPAGMKVELPRSMKGGAVFLNGKRAER